MGIGYFEISGGGGVDKKEVQKMRGLEPG